MRDQNRYIYTVYGNVRQWIRHRQRRRCTSICVAFTIAMQFCPFIQWILPITFQHSANHTNTQKNGSNSVLPNRFDRVRFKTYTECTAATHRLMLPVHRAYAVDEVHSSTNLMESCCIVWRTHSECLYRQFSNIVFRLKTCAATTIRAHTQIS